MTPELTQSPESFLAKFQDPSFSTPITIQLSDLYYGAKNIPHLILLKNTVIYLS